MGYVRVDGEVNIGSNCYIGARCTILPNVFIGNAITVGAATCVSKVIKEQRGLCFSTYNSFRLFV